MEQLENRSLLYSYYHSPYQPQDYYFETPGFEQPAAQADPARESFPRKFGLSASWDLDPIEEIEEHFAGDEPDLRRRSVMIVDADHEHLSYLSNLLSNDTFRVIAADSALEGLRIANVVYLDLVVCNASMPNGSGNFFLKHFRSLPFCKFVPVIMLAEQEQGEMFPDWLGVDAWCLKNQTRVRLNRLTRYFLEE